MKKLASLLLAVIMLATMASFAVAEEPVNLVWWMGCTSQAPIDWPEVEAKLNEISMKEIGATCTFKYMTGEQVGLAMSSGEYFDISFTCNWWNDFATNVSLGMFLDITELAKEYAPKTLELTAENIMVGGYVGDKLYAIPHMKDYGMEVFWILDSDYYLTEKGLQKDPYISFEDIEPYMEMYKKDYPNNYPLMIAKGGVTSWMNCVGDWINQDYLLGLDWAAHGTEDELTVKTAFEIPAFVERIKTIHSWYEKGYINPDAAVVESMGRSVAGVIQSGQGWFGAETVWSNARKKASYIARYDGPFLNTDGLRGSMTAISATTPHAKEAMQLVELMNSNEEYRTLARYGIEGKHYEVVSDGIVQKTELGNSNFSLWAYTQGSYCVGPVEASAFPSVPADPEMWPKVWAGYQFAVTSPAIGFSFDVTPVESECFAIKAVWESYRAELITGTSDPDVVIPQIIAEMETAGLRTVIAEAQKQLDAYMGK